MSKAYSYESSDAQGKTDLMENMAARASVNEKEYTERVLEDEAIMESDEPEWSPRSQSPLAGRMAGSMEELERLQSSENMAAAEVHQCLKDSLDCYQACMETMSRCLSLGGRYAKAEHINLLIDCARICNINADFILRNSTYYPQICGICADICDECGDECDKFDDSFMKECARACRRCAESCREIAR